MTHPSYVGGGNHRADTPRPAHECESGALLGAVVFTFMSYGDLRVAGQGSAGGGVLCQAAHDDVEQQLEALVRVGAREVTGQDREVRNCSGGGPGRGPLPRTPR